MQISEGNETPYWHWNFHVTQFSYLRGSLGGQRRHCPYMNVGERGNMGKCNRSIYRRMDLDVFRYQIFSLYNGRIYRQG